MRRREADFATAEVQAAARHLGSLIRQARLARKWSQTLLAERARVSKPTLSRIEKGAVEPSIGLWLAVLEALGLSSIPRDVRDPVSEALLNTTRTQRARTGRRDDLDF